MPRGYSLQFAFQIQAGINNRSKKFRVADLPKNGEPGRAHQRVAVERATLVAMFETGSRLGSQQRCQRHASADAFSQRHDVRLDSRMLVMEQFSGAADAGLDL